jgi:dienelactone hydrolase
MTRPIRWCLALYLVLALVWIPGALAKEQVVLKWTTCCGQLDRHELFQSWARRYESRNPGVKVEWETEAERKDLEAGERDVALQAVREGYVAIAPDMRGFAGLRRQPEIDKDANNSCRTMQMHAMMFGRTLIGERVWDVMRLIDYATTRPEIDTSRVAVTGNSGGGTVSLFAGACDERITVSAPSSYFCTFEHSIGSIRHCECNYVPGLLAVAEMNDVASLTAPRAFLAVAGRTDPIFPYEATQAAFERVKEAYTAAGVGERCELYTGEGGHRYYKAGIWPFMRRWLA